MHEQLETLQGSAGSTSVLFQESDRLMWAFNAIEAEIQMKTMMPVLLKLLGRQGISPTL